jgi:hypothetical protein
MRVRRALGLAGAVMAGAFAACKDIPFAPKWDADMYMPLSTKSIYLNQAFPIGFIPPNTSGNVSFPPQQQDVGGAVKDVLKNLVTDPTRAQTVLTLTVGKHTAISANDTLFVAPDSISLTAPNTGRVVFPLGLATSDTSVTKGDTIALASIQMMQTAATNQTPLWIQMRGKVSNPSTGPVTITSADSITIKLTVTARVAVSHK